MSAWDGEDRFSLLLLEEGEYYFRDHNCHFWKQPDQRLAGNLKVCSASLFFVPRDAQEPIFRLPFRSTSALERADEERSAGGEDVLRVAAAERTEMKPANRNAPYKRCKGEAEYCFSLVYTSLDGILPRMQSLWRIANCPDTKQGRLQARQQLARTIQEHEAGERFNPGWLEDEDERILLELVGNCITPLCSQPGRVVITNSRLYFQPFNVVSNSPTQTYHLAKIVSVMARTFQLRPVGLEVFFSVRSSLFLSFREPRERERVDALLREQPAVRLQSQRSRLRWMHDWALGRVSNFEYLMHLNHQAGRSFQDLTQYPVFPWVVADYESAELDLSNPATFRDLSKPIGALSTKRLAEFRERYAELRRMHGAGGSFRKLPGGRPPPLEAPPFLYGCHYSTPGYVVYYLLRSEPQLQLRLQNGRFDTPDRLFWSILDTWRSVTSLPTDVKELTPEFYAADPSFLLNLERVDFGCRSNGKEVGDLELPPWARDAQDFVQKLSDALESPHVSARLHRWIDLIFGCRSRGRKAEAADNVFHYLTYDDIALQLLEQESDPAVQDALRVQMMEFGRTPQQLFTARHPKRRVLATGARPRICCFPPGPPKRPPPRPPANLLRPTHQKKKAQSPTVRAVVRLTSSKPVIRAATLAWLEQAGAGREPEYLALTAHTQLLDVVRALRDCLQRGQAESEAADAYVRGLRVLAIAPVNRAFLLEAGALAPLTALLLADPAPRRLDAVVFTLSLLSRDEEDARLNALPPAALRRLLDLARGPAPPLDPGVRAAAAHTLTNLCRCLEHRTQVVQQGGLELLLGLLSAWEADGGEAATVVREAAACLLALLEDDQHKLAVVAAGGLAPLLGVCAAHGSDNGVRARCLQLLAALATHLGLRRVLLEAGALPLLCRLAKLRTPLLQAPAAAALANLCADGGDPPEPEHLRDCLAALDNLSSSGDPEVQRHVARALWHLATSDASRPALLQEPGVAPLLRLAQARDSRCLQSRTLAQRALKRLAEGPGVQEQLPAELLARMEAALAEPLPPPHLTLSPGRRRGTEEGSDAASPTGRQPSSPSRWRLHRRSHADERAQEPSRRPAGWAEGRGSPEGAGWGDPPPAEARPSLLNRLGFRRPHRSTTALDEVGSLGSLGSGGGEAGADLSLASSQASQAELRPLTSASHRGAQEAGADLGSRRSQERLRQGQAGGGSPGGP